MVNLQFLSPEVKRITAKLCMSNKASGNTTVCKEKERNIFTTISI